MTSGRSVWWCVGCQKQNGMQCGPHGAPPALSAAPCTAFWFQSFKHAHRRFYPHKKECRLAKERAFPHQMALLAFRISV